MKCKYVVTILGLLLSITVLSKNHTNHIKKFEEAAHSKLLELQQIGEQISALFHFFDKQSCYADELFYAVKEKLDGVVDISDKELKSYLKKGKVEGSIKAGSEEQIKKAFDELIKIGKVIEDALSGKGPFEYDLANELFEQDKPFVGHCGKARFILIRGMIEGAYLSRSLVTRYQTCLCELAEINQELLALKTKGL